MMLVERPWQTCACSHYACVGSTLPTKCPVHGTPNNGVLQLHRMLQCALPGATIFAELPLLSEGKQGRALLTGQFTTSKAGDCKVDVVVQSPTGLMYALEVCGSEHLTRAYTVQADSKKERVCAQLGIPMQRLWLTRTGRSRSDWQQILQAVKLELLM